MISHTTSIPQEEQRLQIPQGFLYRPIQHLNEYLWKCTVELVFNLDEVGISDWEDRKTTKVVGPATMHGQAIQHGIFRNVKHVSAIACVGTIGKSLLLYIITL
jgi:hypothetical protein